MCRSRNSKLPDSLVTVSFVIPVPSSFNCTAAPGTTASEVSVTVPLMAPVTLTCAAAGSAPAPTSRAQRKERTTLRVFIAFLGWRACDGRAAVSDYNPATDGNAYIGATQGDFAHMRVL